MIKPGDLVALDDLVNASLFALPDGFESMETTGVILNGEPVLVIATYNYDAFVLNGKNQFGWTTMSLMKKVTR